MQAKTFLLELFPAFAQKESEPARILKMINEALVSDLDDRHFVTL